MAPYRVKQGHKTFRVGGIRCSFNDQIYPIIWSIVLEDQRLFRCPICVCNVVYTWFAEIQIHCMICKTPADQGVIWNGRLVAAPEPGDIVVGVFD